MKAKTKSRYPMPPPGRLSVSLDEACGLTGIGKTKLREFIDAGALPTRRIGIKIVIRRADLDDFLKRLPSGRPGTAP